MWSAPTLSMHAAPMPASAPLLDGARPQQRLGREEGERREEEGIGKRLGVWVEFKHSFFKQLMALRR